MRSTPYDWYSVREIKKMIGAEVEHAGEIKRAGAVTPAASAVPNQHPRRTGSRCISTQGWTLQATTAGAAMPDSADSPTAGPPAWRSAPRSRVANSPDPPAAE